VILGIEPSDRERPAATPRSHPKNDAERRTVETHTPARAPSTRVTPLHQPPTATTPGPAAYRRIWIARSATGMAVRTRRSPAATNPAVPYTAATSRSVAPVSLPWDCGIATGASASMSRPTLRVGQAATGLSGSWLASASPRERARRRRIRRDHLGRTASAPSGRSELPQSQTNAAA
jgi:hypothetical protein